MLVQIVGIRNTHLEDCFWVRCHQPQLEGSRFPVQEVLVLHSYCPEVRSADPHCRYHLVPRSNQAKLPPDPDKTLLTFGADVQLRSKTKWPNGDIGGDSK
jgi:hypothetical protein